MANLPNPLKSRPDINYRQGIKSSLSELTKLIGLLVAFHETNSKNATLEFSEEYLDGNKKIRCKPDLLTGLKSFFKEQLANAPDIQIDNIVNNNPLFIAQAEPLQVVIELFFKLGKLSFKGGFPTSHERTGGERFDKIIQFSTNMDILSLSISDEKGFYTEDVKNLLFNWITNKNLPVVDGKLNKIKSILTIFAEDSQFKLRYDSDKEIFFQLEGIYDEIIKNSEVISTDDHESVGPFRILKTFVKSNLHPFLTDSDNNFKLISDISKDSFQNYTKKVSTYLDLINRPKTIYSNIENVVIPNSPTSNQKPKQTIYYGCPGTGKSKAIKDLTAGIEEQYVFRTTFHPEYDYASFVGSYKPTMIDDAEGKPSIAYAFTPQIFTQAYVSAMSKPDVPHYLVIEEINRGNCALIFGDIFQLLDRQSGVSDYAIRPDRDLEQYLSHTLGEKYKNTEGVRLPTNLNILATMNTSDQSLFPMDSAFKRRWEWIYIPIDYEKADDYHILTAVGNYSWGDFLRKINKVIYNITNSEDKQLGTFFVQPEGKNISETQLINKVFFYLWSDIFKNEDRKDADYLFKYLNEDIEETFTYNQLHGADKNKILKGFFQKYAMRELPPRID
jgi:hypothetical protein